ncbi:MAG: hypothetical protein R3C18_17675 [Planctomycetaceae bacterium]
MNRTFTFCLFASMSSLLIGATPASAQFGGWKPPKIPLPPPVEVDRRLQLGPYQQGFIESAAAGAAAGGEVAGVPGAITGGAFGAGAYAHQHDSDKIHNYRTPQAPFPITYWNYGAAQGGGYFQKSGNVWVEMKGGSHWATFQPVGQTANEIVLFDPARNIQVKLDHYGAYWRSPTGQWNYLFNRVR